MQFVTAYLDVEADLRVGQHGRSVGGAPPPLTLPWTFDCHASRYPFRG